MKYAQLTKEQFEELHEEFSKFLATQKIDAKMWQEIKAKRPELADEEMNIFSDLVWDKALNNAKYLEHISKDSLNLFSCMPEQIMRIVVKVEKPGFDFLNNADFDWFLDHSKDAQVSYFKGQKPYTKPRNEEIFDLIKKGSVISKGELFEAVNKIINQ